MSANHPSDRPRADQEPEAAAVVYLCSACGQELDEENAACPRCGLIMLAADDVPTPSSPPWAVYLPPVILAIVLLATFLLKLRNLDHTGLTQWDEVFHAIVAQNVLKHPFKPTLVDVPYLPYDATKWGENHVWLHKPILPFWQIALSFAVLGVSPFALRLPATILSTAAALVTYLIGKQLFDRRAGLLAAVLQAMSPFLVTLVHGYQFADNIDVALLFWVEVGMYFLVRSLKTGSWRDVLLAGVAQGLAFHCKSYLALIVLGVALAAWLLPFLRLGRREACRIGPVRLLGLIGATVATVAPWLVYCMAAYPQEFEHEHAQIWRHLNSNVENWAAPWDRLVFDYLIAIHGVFYTPILVAGILLVGPAVARRHAGLWLMYAWALGVIVPHVFAVTKTPSATLLAVPPCCLLLGFFVSEAWRTGRWLLVGLTIVLAMSVVMPAVIRDPGHGFPNSVAFGGVMRQALWVLDHVGGTLGAVGVLALIWLAVSAWVPVRDSPLGDALHVAAVLFSAMVLGWLSYQTVEAAWRVTSRNFNDRSSPEVGRFARAHLPENAVLLCEPRMGYDHLPLMFYADRTCYLLTWAGRDEMARRIVQAGGVPYVVSHRRLPYHAVYAGAPGGPVVYLWQD